MKKIVLIDNGHGINTPGKRSPDGRLREYRYARDIARRLVAELRNRGIQSQLVVPEEADISLAQRCARVNAVCEQAGARNVLLVSIHNDAAGDGSSWHNARGFSVRVSPHASEASRRLGRCLYEAAKNCGDGVTGNRSVPAAKVWEQNLYILNGTRCRAVLTENLFQDNKEDVAFLLSDVGRAAIVGLHVAGITAYLNSLPR